MSNELKKQGTYELFKTTEGHQILHLNEQNWYALVEGQQGQILVYSDSNHKKDKTLQKGEFYLADFEDDPEFRDIPHLFLKQGDQFKEYILPNGLPTGNDKQKKVIETKELLSEKKVKGHVKGHSKGHSKENKKQFQDKEEGLESKTKATLEQKAKEKGISGRSKMNKEELVKHLKG